MRLKKLYIHGFKSFADRVEMTFEHGVTGVVGPNGCGKSNISDAVRWVLGEQSARQLRGSRMEDVIFNGTEKRRRMAYCEVTLTFDNEDRSLPSDYTEVAVTRRVFRTGESEYLLNGAACRLKDVVDLFRDTGIGRDGYSIVGQGRVGEILSQKSEDRRQVFEEAAGIVKYKARKSEAEKRLDNTEQNLSRIADIISELESRLEPLRLQSEDARKYLAMREEQKGLDLNVFLIRSERYQEKIAELRLTAENMRETLAQNEREQQALNERRESVQNQLSEREEKAAELRESLQALIQEVEAQEGQANVLRERLAASRREQARVEDEKRAAEEGETGMRRRIETLEGEIAREGEGVAAREERQAALDRALEEAEAAAARLETEAEDAKERVIRFMNDMGDVKSEQARLTALGEAIDRQLASLSAGAEEDSRVTADLRRAVEDAEGVWDEENDRLKAMNEAAREISERTRRAGEEYERLTAESQKLLSIKQELGSRLKLLTEMQRDYEGYNLSVKQVLMEAERRGGAGVHGVVASILHAPQRLERALDMVLGGTLQNVVVDRDEDAKAMIEYLKRNRYGRATFLPISSIRGRTLDMGERRVLSMPGCVGLASEMVTYDPIYRGIVENLLGRTVIAEDLNSGIAIQRAGRYQFRLVTLDGDVMHSGGSMTGGSVQSRMTSLLSREREITESAENMKKLTEKLAQAQNQLKKGEEERAALKKERAQLFDDVHQQEIAVTRAEDHLARAREELNGHTGRAARVNEARAQLAEQKAEILSQLDALGQRRETTEDEGEALRKKAQALQTSLSEKRVALNAQRQEVGDARVALATAKRGFEALKQDLVRLNAQKGDAARVLAEAAESLLALACRLKADEEALTTEEGRLELARRGLNGAREDFQRADESRLKAQTELKEISESAERLRVATEEFTDRSHRAEMALSRAENDLEQMTARIWEDYQLTYEGAEPFRDPDFKLAESEKRLNTLRAAIRAMGPVNVSAMDEYRETSERYTELSAQRDDLERAKNDLMGIISELTGKMETQFRAQFEQLDVYFRQTFTELFGGGRAELRLEDPKDALNTGIEIVAQPPGKKLQMLSLLSGGERALTAIAILFAMLKLKPTPFCILDEIEAALDDANIDNFAEYLQTYSTKTQFVVVTHRKGTMSRCDALYGVAMEEKGVSKLVSVKLADAV
ncbi:MAG: chromosome segregation protein SMC [Clostridiales bacterium]|nr:chromosome segregation protein SMC [Clostridiales bacterium]